MPKPSPERILWVAFSHAIGRHIPELALGALKSHPAREKRLFSRPFPSIRSHCAHFQPGPYWIGQAEFARTGGSRTEIPSLIGFYSASWPGNHLTGGADWVNPSDDS